MTMAASITDDGEHLSAELAAALRAGPFDRALDLAIRRRGLSLEAVQRRVALRGATVSQATLSYWRRGGRRPDGDRSLRAVRALEDSLGLPRAALERLLTPVRPRSPEDTAAGLANALDLSPAAIESCDGIDLVGNNRLSLMSLHQHVHIGPDRTERLVRTEIVATARVNGVDRWVSFFHPQDGEGHQPTVVGTRCCRPARARTDPDSELLAVELRFDYPLRSGETYVYSFDIGYEGPPPATDYSQYGLRTPARQLVLQVSFDPAQVPVRCYRYYKSPAGLSSIDGELPLGPSMTTHIAIPDAPPGVHGIRWEWE
ncbi:helix-turn-helix domain-containing protein [Actinokineospora diospyrosa]|uniref:Helix-turn-helix protein n=1 Tax=Actinokineospora diospyrosa TaxID=103728 RepID=A0ABT1INM5_9PSEU|nr:helix-turn-helix transcriptional regulator [Actinokineospora diospyrosa]MCP2274268.1 hypothetical protein [Actinokineospora diospyrosa]